MSAKRKDTPNQTLQPNRESLLKQLKDIDSRIQDFEREKEKFLNEKAIETMNSYQQMLLESGLGPREITAKEIRDQILVFYNNMPECKESTKQSLERAELCVKSLSRMFKELRIKENLDELKRERDKVSTDLAEAQKKESEKTPEASDGKIAEFTDTEENILEALGEETMTGEKLAKKAGYPYNSNFKNTLSSLRKRGVLGNKSPGYFVEPKYRSSLKKSD